MKLIVLAIAAAVSIQSLVLAQDPVKVEPTSGGTGATIGVDVLSPWQATKSFIAGNWGKILLGAGTAIAIDRVAYNNDWLWYEGNKDSSPRNTSGGNLAVDTASTSTGSSVTVNGDGNVVNQTIIVQTPANGPAVQDSPITEGSGE